MIVQPIGKFKLTYANGISQVKARESAKKVIIK